MRQFDAEGRLHFPASADGRLRQKLYADEREGTKVQNLWDDISPIGAQAAERLGYPTQKPLALLERIIQASSNEGDVVLDPFCGCGTAVHAAEKLKRQWIGIDITHLAVHLIEKRLKQAFPGITFEVQGVPQDFAGAKDLADRDKHQFQLWACTLVDAQPYKGGKKGSDKGIDGLIYPEVEKGKSEKIVVSVKGGEHVGVSFIRDLVGTVEREKAIIGLYVGLTPPTREMVKEAASAGMYESPHHGAFPKIQILTIEDLLSGKARALYPDMAYGGQTFKKAKKETKGGKQETLFD